MESPIDDKDRLPDVALTLIRSVFPPAKGIRLVGVTLSNFRSMDVGAGEELSFAISPHRGAAQTL